MPIKSVVTGGAGFIGSALVRELLAAGEERVAVLDNLNSGKLANLAEVAGLVDTHIVYIRDYDAVARVFAGAEVVYHLAAIPSVPRSIQDPVPSHDVNINGTFNVYRAAKEAGVRRVVYAASSSAYGEIGTSAKVEDQTPSPLSPYAVAKLAGEYYCQVFAKVYGLETVALRYFNVFGPRQDPSSPYSGVISKFVTSLLAGQAPQIYGDGEQSRDFTYIANVVDANLRAAESPAASGQVINVGTASRTTLNQLLAELQQIIGTALTPQYAETRAGDVRHSLADLTRAAALLGYAPQTDLATGLRLTVDWYREVTE